MTAEAAEPEEVAAPSFYELRGLVAEPISSTPGAAEEVLAQFEERVVAANANRLALSRQVLADQRPDPDVWPGITLAYEIAPGGELKGALGLALMLRKAYLITADPSRGEIADLPDSDEEETRTTAELQRLADAAAMQRQLEEATVFIRDPDVQKVFVTFYGIPPGISFDQARMHRVGTTSFILSCHTHSDADNKFTKTTKIALKCLLAQYLSVRAILEQTEAYKKDHALESKYTPTIYDSGELFIAMDFIEGPTLAEHFEERVLDQELDVDFIRGLSVTLCEVLEDLAANSDQHHLDLSPSNIIVTTPEAADVPQLMLIDFGHNFLVSERGVGSNAAFRRAAVYIAPELLENPEIDAYTCDLYSLGLIILQAASPSLLEEAHVARSLEDLWERAPGLARVVEDLIDRKPENRLLLMNAAPPTYRAHPYKYLTTLINQESEVLEELREETGGTKEPMLRGLGLVFAAHRADAVNVLRAHGKIQKPVDPTYMAAGMLAMWVRVSVWAWGAAWIGLIALTVGDILPRSDTSIWSGYSSLIPVAHFHVGNFWQNLPGRMVAFTFSITAVTYYVNIYSMLSPRTVGTRLGRAAEFVARPILPICLNVAILWAMYLNPNSWPYCAGLGTVTVWVNNLLFYKLTLQADEHGGTGGARFSTVGHSLQKWATEEYREWWLQMLQYSSAMLVVGVLLSTHNAHDRTIYAVFVCVINVLKMYRQNCTAKAPKTRGYLGKAILTLRRAKYAPDKGTQMQTAATGDA